MIKRYLIVGAMTALIALIAACGGGSPSNSELVALGEKEFGTCAGCHGADATGVTGLGKSLVGSDFITNISDSDLATLIKTGRPSSDPANTTGIDMPPKGGNPALNDDKIDGLVAYIRSIQ